MSEEVPFETDLANSSQAGHRSRVLERRSHGVVTRRGGLTLELIERANLAFDELLGVFGHVLDRLARLANLLEVGVKRLHDLLNVGDEALRSVR